MECIKNFIISTDNFGQGIELKINKQNKVKTFFGGFLTILMILFCLSMFYVNGQNMIHQKHPQINIEHLMDIEMKNTTLNNTRIPFSIFVSSNSNAGIFNDAYFKFHVTLLQGNPEGLLIKTKLPLTYCRKDDHFPLISNKTFYDMRLNTHLCVDNYNLDLCGFWGDPYISYMAVTLTLCKNNSKTQNCASESEILKYFSNPNMTYYFNIVLMNTIINPQNNASPLTYSMLEFYKVIKPSAPKVQEIFVREETLITDDGYIMEDLDQQDVVSFFNTNADDYTMGDAVVEFDIFTSNEALIFRRMYMKVPNVLAAVGGLANILNIAFLICCRIFSVVKRDEIMLNRVFDFDITSKNEKIEGPKLQMIKLDVNNIANNPSNNTIVRSRDNSNLNNCNLIDKKDKDDNVSSYKKNVTNDVSIIKNDNQSKRDYNSEGENNSPINNKSSYLAPLKKNNSRKFIGRNSISDNRIIRENINENTEMKTAKQIIELLKSKNKKYNLAFTSTEIIRGFICCKSAMNPDIKMKKDLYDKCKFSLEEFFDISYIIQKFEELEKLKIVLLNDHQLALFNFIKKELISLNDEKVNNPISRYKRFYKNREQLVNIIVEFREKMIKRHNVKSIDKKLFILLDPIFNKQL